MRKKKKVGGSYKVGVDEKCQKWLKLAIFGIFLAKSTSIAKNLLLHYVSFSFFGRLNQGSGIFLGYGYSIVLDGTGI